MSFSENYEITEGVDGSYTALDPATNISGHGDSRKRAVESLQENLEDYYSSESNNSDFYLGMRKSGFMVMIMVLFTVFMSLVICSIILFIRFG